MDTRVMDAGAEGWMIKHAKRQLWRMPDWYDIDDLIQEGRCAWAQVLHTYPDAVDPPHLMRLFQRTFQSRIEDMAKRKYKQVDSPESTFAREEVDRSIMAKLFVDELGSLAIMIEKAPPVVKRVLELVNSEEGRRQLNSEFRLDRNGHAETLMERLFRLAKDWLSPQFETEKVQGLLQNAASVKKLLDDLMHIPGDKEFRACIEKLAVAISVVVDGDLVSAVDMKAIVEQLKDIPGNKRFREWVKEFEVVTSANAPTKGGKNRKKVMNSAYTPPVDVEALVQDYFHAYG